MAKVNTSSRDRSGKPAKGRLVCERGLATDSPAAAQEKNKQSSNLNRLTKVEDAVATTVGVNDFKNAVNVATEYTYTTAGDLNTDQNKGITGTTYNVLGKPRQITFSNNRRVDYFYDAAGNKTKVQVYTGSPLTLTSTTDYVGGFVYENNALSFFSSPEGRVVKNGANFEYQYAIAYHQGNTRVVFTSAAQTPQAVAANFEATANANFQNYVNRSSFALFYSFNQPNKVVDVNGADPYSYAERLLDGIRSTLPAVDGAGGGNAGYGYAYGHNTEFGAQRLPMGSGGWVLNIGNLEVNYNLLEDGLHLFGFGSGGALQSYDAYDFQMVNSVYGATYKFIDQFGNSDNDLVYSFG
ncbi:MAG: hypothetical protein ACKOE6_06640, partial [Flammeovirgaceae bacterium]